MLSFCSLTLQKVPLSYSAPAPNVPASPSSRAPSRRQRVQRLRQFFVAEDSFKDSSPLFRLGDFAHAGCPISTDMIKKAIDFRLLSRFVP